MCCESATVVLMGVSVAVSVRGGWLARCQSDCFSGVDGCLYCSGWWVCCRSARVVLMGVCIAVSVRAGR